VIAMVPGVFALAGVVMVVAAVREMRGEARRRRCGIRADAELVRLTWDHAPTGQSGYPTGTEPVYQARVRFAAQDGRVVERDLEVSGRLYARLARGPKRVAVLSMPDDPEDCIVAADSGRTIERCVLLVAGLTFAVVGTIGAVCMARDPQYR
jgi:hypothetical protein